LKILTRMPARPLLLGLSTAACHVVALLFLLACHTRLLGQDDGSAEIRPPFGLAWGESADLLETAIAQAGGKIIQRHKTGADSEVWEVKGLEQKALQTANFSLTAGKLSEVELQYWKEDWSAQTYDEFMQRARKYLEDKHGPGRLLARRQESEGKGLRKTLVGYRWEKQTAAIELYYFSAQDPKNLFRSLSLHYKSPTGAAQP
jgi:hypothetical protein